MLSLANLPKIKGRSKKRKRVGRGQGSGHGKQSCKGHKGQKARAGCRIIGNFEGGQMPLTRRVPKRGFRNPFKKEFAVCNIQDLNDLKVKSDVDWKLLYDEGIVGKAKDGLKVLGQGELKVALNIKANAFSQSAIKKIEAAGGKAEVIGQ